MEAKSFLSVEECRNVIDAIAEAEKNCSGEIRVNIANKAGENVMESAVNVFYSLEMDKTLRKNGVLFFIASEDRRFAVIGDEGINNVVPENFWNDVCALMIEYFKKEEFGALDGLDLQLRNDATADAEAAMVCESYSCKK